MKIAVASEGKMVAGHFGHCRNFNIYEVQQKQIVAHESIDNPGHRPGFLPRFLKDLGVKAIISGGMGGAAVQLFNEFSIEVVIGTKGLTDDAVNQYIKGELESTGSICHEHEHHDECSDHN